MLTGRDPPDEDAKAARARKGTAKRVRECRERDGNIGTFEYDGEWLTYLLSRRRPSTGLPYLSEAEIMLGQSESKRVRRLYDLALRRATTALHQDLLAGKLPSTA